MIKKKQNKNKNKKMKKIQIILKSYDVLEINKAITNICETLKNNNISFSNVISLPTHILSLPIKRSYFIYGYAKSHFGIKTYKKFFYIYLNKNINLAFLIGIKVHNIVKIKIKR